jgi:hypothetical protein
MQDATRNTRHCGISCAAGSGQRRTSSMREALYATTSAQHGTDATQDATHDHTTRAAACTKHKRNRQHAAGNAMYEMRRTKSGRSRTSGHAAPAVVESDGLLDSDCRRVPSQSSRATRKTGIRVRRNRPREIQCPKTAAWDGERPKRQEVAEAKERESALRSRREQLVKGALNPRTKRAVRPPPKVQRSEPDAAPRCASFRTSFVLPRVFSCEFAACCIVLCEASVPCCALVVEYKAWPMLLVVRCPLLAAHEMRNAAVPCVSCCISQG